MVLHMMPHITSCCCCCCCFYFCLLGKVPMVLHMMPSITSCCCCFYFCLRGKVPMVLQMMPSITSSAPPPMEFSRRSLCILLMRTSLVKPMPPQYCRQESVTSLQSL